MTTGKPDFNLNSFGIKYLSKDEVQEFLNKYKTPTGADQAALATERDKKGTGFKTSESANKLVSDVTPKVPEVKQQGITNNTEYIFNDPKYGIPDTRKPQTTGHGKKGIVPPNTPALDTRISTGTAIGNKGNREGGVGHAPEELTGDDIRSSKQGNRTVSVGVGQKGKEVFDKKEGVGEKYVKQYHADGSIITQKERKEKLESDKKSKEKREKDTKLKQALHKLEQQKQYDKKIQQKTGEGSKIETEPTIETESEESFKKRSADNERKRQADASKKKKKLTDNERMTKILEEHRAARGLGKSNDIIMDMNIVKLDLMKGKKDALPKEGNKDTGSSKIVDDSFAAQATQTRARGMGDVLLHEDGYTGKLNAIGNATKLGKSADETIFKAISLKLDLMKMEKKGLTQGYYDKHTEPNEHEKFTEPEKIKISPNKRVSSGNNPIKTKLDGIKVQNKLQEIKDESQQVTPKDTARHKKLAETGATGEKAGSVASRYTVNNP